MGYIKEVLLGKLDSDTFGATWVKGVHPDTHKFSFVSGSAPEGKLRDPQVLCIEVGGSGRLEENNGDHHQPGGPEESATLQFQKQRALIVQYIDDVDRGRLLKSSRKVWPSLVQLISGMMLVIKDPLEQVRRSHVIFDTVLHTGVDPYGSMESILDFIPDAQTWVAEKKEHEAKFTDVLNSAKWFTTTAGYRLAAVETTWIGAPGALTGAGAEVVIALNPVMEKRDGAGTVRKFTIAGNDIDVRPVLVKLAETEPGWGGSAHGTIGGSPQKDGSSMTLEEVIETVISEL